MEGVYENARTVLERISRAAVESGRSPESIKLVAASKMNSAERVRQAYDAGVRAFGENRVQEMTEKLALGAYEGAELHFIGHLQKNKVKNVVGKAQVIESVDSLELMELIGRRAVAMGICQDVFVEINIGREENKSGIEKERTDEFLAQCGNISGIMVKGLMAIPPKSADIWKTERYFEEMSKLFIDMKAKKYDNVNMTFLSMGMSSDFEAAIRRGANIVRVGTAIFGERIYK